MSAEKMPTPRQLSVLEKLNGEMHCMFEAGFNFDDTRSPWQIIKLKLGTEENPVINESDGQFIARFSIRQLPEKSVITMLENKWISRARFETWVKRNETAPARRQFRSPYIITPVGVSVLYKAQREYKQRKPKRIPKRHQKINDLIATFRYCMKSKHHISAAYVAGRIKGMSEIDDAFPFAERMRLDTIASTLHEEALELKGRKS